MAYTFLFLFLSTCYACYAFNAFEQAQRIDEEQPFYLPAFDLAGTALGVPKINISREIIRSWAQYSPAYSLGPYAVPDGCTVTQVSCVVPTRMIRHGD